MALIALARGVTRPVCCILVVALYLSAPHVVVSQEGAVSSLSPAQIDEALRIASDDNAAQKFLADYVLQTRSGLGSGHE